jgi:hypothetical protein
VTGTSRARLAKIAAVAGYPPSLLSLIAETTLPRYQAGEQLDETQVEQITQAVEVLAQAGRTAENLPVLIAEYRHHHASAWRERFWAQTLRTASLRYAHPERCGLSPGETDPTRIAGRGSPSTAAHARAA